ncbi:MAG: hypothetical protein RRY79_01580 [Clostridia bacterium]
MKLRLLILILALTLIFMGCASDKEPATSPTPISLKTNVPISTETPRAGFEFDSEKSVAVSPYLAAMIEGIMQPDNLTLFPEARGSINYKAAFAFLFSYAQANCYDADKGAIMTDEQVKTALSVAFAGEYTLEKFISEIQPNESFKYENGEFNFGQGESYSPTLNYKSGTIILDGTVPVEFEYIIPEGGTGTVGVTFAENANALGVTIVMVTINAQNEG